MTGTITKTKTKTQKKNDFDFFAGIIAAIDGKEKISDVPHAVATENQNAKDYFFETRGAMESYRPAESISKRLDSLIGKGAAFDVAEDDFIITGAENLSESERRYLDFNKAPVLCTLQQRLLVKYLFCDSAELLNDFAVEIYERESIQAEETHVYTYDTYFAAVSETTKKWFARLLDAAI